jgi:1-acyl-sn-glycerol-3-phosphate acyltransferase
MQAVVFEEPYRFIPPVRKNWWPALIKHIVRPILRRSYGIQSYEYRGLEHYRQAVAAGHGILVAVNHCRPEDPLVVGTLVKETGQPMYAMASWHVFKQTWLQAWLVRRCGAFSIYREGVDRTALNVAIDILATAERPLMIFPEGAISRHNDLLNSLLDGTTFITRTAARRRAKNQSGRVVVQPLALKYRFLGDLERSLSPVIESIEKRLTWQPQEQLSMLERVFKIGEALLTLKELEYLGESQAGPLRERLDRLREAVFAPIEIEWGVGDDDESTVERVKRLRSAILPDMVAGKVGQEERKRRWRQLADLYFAQQVSFYPPEYVRSNPTPERLMETVERFDEDLHDVAKIHRPWHVILEFGEPIEVGPEKIRGSKDPLLGEIAQRMRALLAKLQAESGPPLPLPETLPAIGL